MKTKNKELNSIVTKKTRIEVGDWVLVYDDKITIAGGGQHMLKQYDYSNSGKSHALVGKLAHRWPGPNKVLFVGPGQMKPPD